MPGELTRHRSRRTSEIIVSDILSLMESGKPVDEFKPLIHEVLTVADRAQVGTHDLGVVVYRAAKHLASLPQRVEDLSHPPHTKAKDNRANRAGSPMFYCASDPAAANFEIGTRVGDTVILSEWETTQPLMVVYLGYAQLVRERFAAKRDFRTYNLRESEVTDVSERELLNFLALTFMDPNPTDYRLTIAIAEAMLNGPMHGLQYPSVRKNARTDNLALTPDFVQRGLRLRKATALIVDRLDGEAIEGTVLAWLAAVGDGGNLAWEGPPVCEHVPPGLTHEISFGSPILFLSRSEVGIDGHVYSLEPGHSLCWEHRGIVVYDLQGIELSCVAAEPPASPGGLVERGYCFVRSEF